MNTRHTKKLVGHAVKGSLFALALSAAGSAVAFSGGGFITGGYIGPVQTSWYEEEACATGPISFAEDPVFRIQEWRVDVAGVRDDGDPNTYARCQAYGSATFHELLCSVGLPDGTAIVCNDVRSSQSIPEAGDDLYMAFAVDSQGEIEECEVVVSRSFGEADPKCRVGGDGDGDGDGDGTIDFPCDAGNSTPFPKETITSATVDTCYSIDKASGTLRMATWQGQNFIVHAEDSEGTQFMSNSIASGAWSEIVGVADGQVYFYVSSTSSGSGLPLQVSYW